MKMMKKIGLMLAIIPLVAILSSCTKTAENEHLPEYCRSYSDFIEFASRDMYELVDGINRHDYFDAISEIELDLNSADLPDPETPGEIDLDGIQCFQNLTSLSLTGPGFKDISEISALKNIQEISLVNTSVVSIDSFKNLSKVKSLTITDTKTLQSVKGVEEMTKLRNLELVGNGIVNIESLSALINLESLDLSDNEMVFFPEIVGLEKLTSLNLSNNKIERLGNDLSGLAHLKILDLSNNRIDDLSKFDDLSDLEYLNLSNNNLGRFGVSPDFTSLSNATGLEEFHLNGNNLTDISGLEDVYIPNLMYLYLHDNQISDISYISEYNKIVDLTLYNNNLTSIDNITGMTELTEIDLSNNNIESFGGLTNITNLKSINLQNNKIKVIPDLTLLPNLLYLDLSYNILEDTSGLEGHPALEELHLDNNGLETLTGLKDIFFLETITLYDEDGICLDEVFFEELGCVELKYPLNPNRISNFVDSFVNLASYTDLSNAIRDFNMDVINFGENITIERSFINIPDVREIDFTSMDINSIDAESFVFPQLTQLFLGNNNISNIDFLHGNPSLTEVVLSGNPITNLEIFNGTEKTDFDNLQSIIANNIIAPNDLDGGFVDLPELSILDLSSTNITGINNSFNNLPQLTQLAINSSGVVAINNSFNELFTLTANLPSVQNGINFQNGSVYEIVNSFNDGIFEYINISNQSTAELNTVITDSFNNTELTASDLGLNLSTSNYQVITNSFNNLIAQNLSLANSNVNEITNSFENIELQDYLRLYLNNLATLPDLSSTTMRQLSLQSNRLTTVDFIHDITGLESLELDNQFDELSNATLLAIDGINNQPDLVDLSLTNLQITSIDGLRNVGLKEFEYQASDHNDVQIETITTTSFENNLITALNLGGNEMDDMTFLDNFDLLTEMAISFSATEMDFFIDQDFTDSLTSLVIATNASISTFTPLHDYDVLETLIVIAPFTNVYNDIDNMDALSEFTIYFPESVLEFNNSFNALASFLPAGDYITSGYPNLQTVRESFHQFAGTFQLPGHVATVNSFDNVTELTVLSSIETFSLIDSESFDSVTDLVLDGTNYITYASFADFESLETLDFVNLEGNILDFANVNVSEINVPGASNSSEILSFNVLPATQITILNPETDIAVSTTTNAITIDSENDVALSSSEPAFTLTGTMNNLLMSGVDTTSLNFDNVVVTNEIVMDTVNLDTITSTIQQNINASQITVNSDVAILDYEISVDTMVINNNSATDITAAANDSLTIINNQPTLQVDVAATTINLINTALTTLNGTFDTNDMTLSSLVLASFDFEGTTNTDFVINTASPTFTLSGTGTTNVTINDDFLTALTLAASNAVVDFNTFVNNTVTIDGAVDEITINGNQIQELTISNGDIGTVLMNGTDFTALHFSASEVTLFDAPNASILADINMIDSSVGTLDIYSDVLNIDISRAHPTANGLANDQNTLLLSGVNTDNYILNVDNTDVTITTAASVLNADIIADLVIFETTNMTDIYFTDTTVILDAQLHEGTLLQTVDLGLATMDELNITSEVGNLVVSAVNATLVDITGNNVTNLTVNNTGNQTTFHTTNIGNVTFNIQTNDFNLDGNLANIIFDNATVLTSFTSDTDNLVSINANSASLGAIDITDSSQSLTINGVNITDLTVSSNAYDTLLIGVDPSASVVLNSTFNGAAEITTSTTDIDMTFPNSTVTLFGGEITNVSGTVEELDFNGTKLSLTPNFTLTTDLLTLDTTNIVGLNILDGSAITDLVILNTQLTSIVVSGTGVVANLDLTTNETTFTVDGNVVNTAFNAVNASSFVSTNNTTGNIVVTTDSTLFSPVGTFTSVEVNADNLTVYDASNATVEDLTIVSNSLSSINTFTNVLNNLTIENEVDNFNITTEANTVTYTGLIANNVVLSSSKAGSIIFDTNVNSVSVTTPSANVTVDAVNLETINGTVNELGLQNIDILGVLDINVGATNLVYAASNNAAGINFSGIKTIGTLSILGDAATVNTNTTTIQESFTLGGFDYVVTTDFDVFTFNGSGTVEITIPDTALVTLSGSVSNLTFTGVTDEVLLDITGDVILNYTAASDVDISGTVGTVTVNGITDIVALTLTGDAVLNYNSSASVTMNGSADSVTVNGINNTVNANITGVVELIFEDSSDVTINGTTPDVIVSGVTQNVTTNVSASADITFNAGGNVTINGTTPVVTISGVTNIVTVNAPTSAAIDFDASANAVINGTTPVVTISGVTSNVTVNVPTSANITFDASANAIINGTTPVISVSGVTSNVETNVSQSAEITFNNSSNVNITGTTPLVDVYGISNLVGLGGFDEVTLNYGVATSTIISGSAINLTVIGNSLNNINTDSLSLVEVLVMDEIGTASIDFVGTGLYSSLLEIHMIGLQSEDAPSVATALEGTNITLYSSIVEQDVYDHYLTEAIGSLLLQENIDNVRYDGFRATEVAEALAVFRLNTSFDYINDVDLIFDIEQYIDSAATYNLDDYMNGYAVNQGYVDEAAMREDLGDTAVDAIRNAMEATLQDPELDIQEATIINNVTESIETDAAVIATDNNSNRGWTIG